ncbi:MAG TPA: methyltransferase type 12 [Woeseiaceae bacterium]|nr:methyltransferase type 12 [Woeseiaceae bacterium]
MPHDKRTFFRAFLRSPQVVASVIPSSSFVERRVVHAADVTRAGVAVELGGGVGGITRSLLHTMGPQARLLVMERTDRFVEVLKRIDDSRLEIVHGCASTIVAQLARRNLPAADAVVSGIPFSTMPNALGAEIIAAVYDALAPGGRFVAYQLSDRVVRYARPLLGEPAIEYEFRNVPPLRVFTWQKAGGLRKTNGL